MLRQQIYLRIKPANLWKNYGVSSYILTFLPHIKKLSFKLKLRL